MMSQTKGYKMSALMNCVYNLRGQLLAVVVVTLVWTFITIRRLDSQMTLKLDSLGLNVTPIRCPSVADDANWQDNDERPSHSGQTYFISDFGQIHQEDGRTTDQQTEVISNKNRKCINSGSSKYAVFGIAMPNLHDGKDKLWHYAFYVPFAVHSWARLNISSIILVTGENVSRHSWNSHIALNKIFTLIRKVPNVRFVYLNISNLKKVTIAQSVRIFASSLTRDLNADDILITTDVDMVPFDNFLPYTHPANDSVILLDANTLPFFTNKGKSYRMILMPHVIGSATTWNKIACNHTVQNVDDVLAALESYVEVPDAVKRGGGGWFIDQIILSILVVESGVKQIPIERSTSQRLNSCYPLQWLPFLFTIKDKIDAHMRSPGWAFVEKMKLKKLVRAVFEDRQLVSDFDTYMDTFGGILQPCSTFDILFPGYVCIIVSLCLLCCIRLIKYSRKT